MLPALIVQGCPNKLKIPPSYREVGVICILRGNAFSCKTTGAIVVSFTVQDYTTFDE